MVPLSLKLAIHGKLEFQLCLHWQLKLYWPSKNKESFIFVRSLSFTTQRDFQLLRSGSQLNVFASKTLLLNFGGFHQHQGRKQIIGVSLKNIVRVCRSFLLEGRITQVG